MHVKTIVKRLGRGLKAVWEWCKQHRHDPGNEQQKTLNAKLRRHYQYCGRRTNYRSQRNRAGVHVHSLDGSQNRIVADRHSNRDSNLSPGRPPIP
jgi:hypothetical protein